MKGIVFPYKIYHGLHCPIVPLGITGPSGSLITEAYVDSGAFYSIFSSNIAIGLGLAYKKVSAAPVIVGDGNTIPVYFHRLPIKIGFVNLKATIGFSDKLGIGFNLLGRHDIFRRFDITFSDNKKIITFNEVSSPSRPSSTAKQSNILKRAAILARRLSDDEIVTSVRETRDSGLKKSLQ